MEADSQSTSVMLRTIGVGNTGAGLSLTIRNGTVVLGTTDLADKNQYWIKDNTYGSTVLDAEGNLSFVLINQGTGQALKHANHNEPVGLVQYDPNNYDSKLLWTDSSDLGDGYRFIRRLDQLNLVFDGEFGYVKDGSRLIMYNKQGSDNEKWRFELSPNAARATTPQRVFSFSALMTSLSIINGAPVLVPNDSYDDNQDWIVDTRYSFQVDKDRNPAFSLSNKVTGQFLQYVKDGNSYKVQLATADPNALADSLLWTKGTEDFGQDYRNIRILTDRNINLTFKHDTSTNGFPLLLDNNNTSKEAMWKIVPRS